MKRKAPIEFLDEILAERPKPLTALAVEKVIDLSDFGAEPDSKQDALPAIHKAIAEPPWPPGIRERFYSRKGLTISIYRKTGIGHVCHWRTRATCFWTAAVRS